MVPRLNPKQGVGGREHPHMDMEWNLENMAIFQSPFIYHFMFVDIDMMPSWP